MGDGSSGLSFFSQGWSMKRFTSALAHLHIDDDANTMPSLVCWLHNYNIPVAHKNKAPVNTGALFLFS